MRDPVSAGTEVFICYAHKDERLRATLDEGLALLQREGVVSVWHDRQIAAGSEWRVTSTRTWNPSASSCSWSAPRSLPRTIVGALRSSAPWSGTRRVQRW